eukprot:TRINITY_DN34001_c0_g1_i1.p1 TRINITY_DN34001_c0_g1~~TRINITY_DN34001_c0_g1_i1.p1  ORF type:complete len:1355 (-),score=292.58 TRINITY_DN34001_c0_g1_i1:61-4125(-)
MGRCSLQGAERTGSSPEAASRSLQAIVYSRRAAPFEDDYKRALADVVRTFSTWPPIAVDAVTTVHAEDAVPNGSLLSSPDLPRPTFYGADGREATARRSVVPSPPVHCHDSLLAFSSAFECGNLLTARLVDVQEASCGAPPHAEYELEMECDTQSSGQHTQWFYFACHNQIPCSATFRIVNFRKKRSLYAVGMQPHVCSTLGGSEWDAATCSNIQYMASPKRGAKEAQLYTLSFRYEFRHAGDTVYFSSYTPYSYTQLRSFITRLAEHPDTGQHLVVNTLCKSLSGLPLPLLLISNHVPAACTGIHTGDGCGPAGGLHRERMLASLRRKPAVVIIARQHPGEVVASYVMAGFLRFLLGPSPEAAALRDRFCFHIVPMVNVDGVVHGNARCTLAGADPNRCWAHPCQELHTEVHRLREYLHGVQQRSSSQLFLDIHGHSQRTSAFFYGTCASDLRNAVFPKLASLASKDIDFGSSRWQHGRSHNRTARAVAVNQCGISNSYTFEASLFGQRLPLGGALAPEDRRRKPQVKDYIFMPQRAESIGCALGRAMVCFFGLDRALTPSPAGGLPLCGTDPMPPATTTDGCECSENAEEAACGHDAGAKEVVLPAGALQKSPDDAPLAPVIAQQLLEKDDGAGCGDDTSCSTRASDEDRSEDPSSRSPVAPSLEEEAAVVPPDQDEVTATPELEADRVSRVATLARRLEAIQTSPTLHTAGAAAQMPAVQMPHQSQPLQQFEVFDGSEAKCMPWLTYEHLSTVTPDSLLAGFKSKASNAIDLVRQYQTEVLMAEAAGVLPEEEANDCTMESEAQAESDSDVSSSGEADCKGEPAAAAPDVTKKRLLSGSIQPRGMGSTSLRRSGQGDVAGGRAGAPTTNRRDLHSGRGAGLLRKNSTLLGDREGLDAIPFRERDEADQMRSPGHHGRHSSGGGGGAGIRVGAMFQKGSSKSPLAAVAAPPGGGWQREHREAGAGKSHAAAAAGLQRAPTCDTYLLEECEAELQLSLRLLRKAAVPGQAELLQPGNKQALQRRPVSRPAGGAGGAASDRTGMLQHLEHLGASRSLQNTQAQVQRAAGQRALRMWDGPAASAAHSACGAAAKASAQSLHEIRGPLPSSGTRRLINAGSSPAPGSAGSAGSGGAAGFGNSDANWKSATEDAREARTPPLPLLSPKLAGSGGPTRLPSLTTPNAPGSRDPWSPQTSCSTSSLSRAATNGSCALPGQSPLASSAQATLAHQERCCAAIAAGDTDAAASLQLQRQREDGMAAAPLTSLGGADEASPAGAGGRGGRHASLGRLLGLQLPGDATPLWDTLVVGGKSLTASAPAVGLRPGTRRTPLTVAAAGMQQRASPAVDDGDVVEKS